MISLTPRDLKWIQQTLGRLKDDVTFVYFTEETSCRHCQQEKDLLLGLSDLATKLHLEVHDFAIDGETADRYGVDKVPGTVLVGKKDYGVRYYGMPSGFEFQAFMEDVLRVSEGESRLSHVTKEKLGALSMPVHIEVVTTAACPFSMTAVRIAHQLAVESDWITADVVDAVDFPDLVQQYDVLGAPTVVINETHQLYGGLQEEEFVEEVLKGAQESSR